VLDPRTKLILVIYYAVLVVASRRVPSLAVEGAVLIVFILAMRRLKAYGRWLRLVLPMAVFFGAVTAWSAGPPAGALAGWKLLTLTTVFFAFFAVTLPEDLGNALVQMGLPYSAAFVTTTAMQFVPVIGRKARGVIAAQQARGIPLEPGWSALRHYPAFLGPLLLQAFQLAEELAEALEARGFGRPGRSFYREYRLRTRDWIAMGIGAAVTAAGLMSPFPL
jgi:energy-coupling factor transport system permease protein